MRTTATMSRKQQRFRYPDDPREVTLELSAAQARAVAWSLRGCTFEDSAVGDQAEALGADLEEFMERSEESNADVIKLDEEGTDDG